MQWTARDTVVSWAGRGGDADQYVHTKIGIDALQSHRHLSILALSFNKNQFFS
jgi:hypothetical protein